MDRAAENLRVRYGPEGLPTIGQLALASDAEDGGEAVSSADEAGPRLFVRAILARPSPPWDQARAARLEARLNAPLPLDQVAFVLKRLESWKPGAASRYVAVYARHADVRDGLTATAQLDGQAIPVRFPSPQKRQEQAKLFAGVTAGAALGMFLLVITTASVLAIRGEADSRLTMVEQSTQRRLQETRRRDALQSQVRALEAAGLERLRAGEVVADLDWVATAKAPDVSVEAVFREGAVLAVEVRGDQAPFVSAGHRVVQRSSKPVRRGVWLWGAAKGESEAGAVR